MTYSATRDSEQLRYLQADIASFVVRHQSRPPGPNRRQFSCFRAEWQVSCFEHARPISQAGARTRLSSTTRFG